MGGFGVSQRPLIHSSLHHLHLLVLMIGKASHQRRHLTAEAGRMAPDRWRDNLDWKSGPRHRVVRWRDHLDWLLGQAALFQWMACVIQKVVMYANLCNKLSVYQVMGHEHHHNLGIKNEVQHPRP
jgi:hypothetical protein